MKLQEIAMGLEGEIKILETYASNYARDTLFEPKRCEILDLQVGKPGIILVHTEIENVPAKLVTSEVKGISRENSIRFRTRNSLYEIIPDKEKS